MNLAKRLFDLFFSSFWWYRDFCGGNWSKIRVHSLVYGDFTESWVRGDGSDQKDAEVLLTEPHSYW